MSAVASAISDLATVFAGRLLQPGEPAYDDARKIHNGLIEKRPALIAQCRGVADIADSVRLARTLGLDVAVRGGGHNPAGRATIDGGLMIDLSRMRAVLVDPVRRTARVEGGALWRDVNRDTQAYGLAVTGGTVGTTGVGGLTLGGGLGWLMAKHGMTLDNLTAVDLVLADGTLVRASAQEHPDLFWAVRGGGGNFGIAASFEFRLHPVGPTVMGGVVAWPFSRARDVLGFYRDITAAASDDFMAFGAFLTAPDGVTKLVAIASAHFGSPGDAESVARRIKSFGTPVMDALGPISYVALNGLMDAAFPKGALNYWKSAFVETLSDGALEALAGRFAACPSPMTLMILEHFHGAATRVAPTETAYALRSEGYNTAAISVWNDTSINDACIRWTKDTYEAFVPFAGAKRYLNYYDRDDTADAVLAAAYGPNLTRLREIKKKYDPDNFFRMNVNIPPA
jgi:FAD/FMN-containing dehydrogenase